MSKKQETKARILDAAQVLFAERGFAETSLRAITTRANVNLASVNYHFGSKKSLIQAVFDRFLADFTRELSRELRLMDADAPVTIERVLEGLIEPLITINKQQANGISIFMRLLGRAYAETQGHLRRYVTERYGHVLEQFTAQLQKAYPSLDMSQVFWRLHFMLGSLIFTLAGSEALREISESDFGQKVSIEELIHQIIPFLAAGMRAEA